MPSKSKIINGLFNSPIWKRENRQDFLNTKRENRQDHISMKWKYENKEMNH